MEESVTGACVLQMGLQAEGELEEPGPLVLHGQHVRLDDGGGGVVGDDQALPPVHHGAELRLALLKLRHQFLAKRERVSC